MSTAVAAAIKAALLALTDENARKKIGWVLVTIFSPVILLIALLCSLASGGAEHNISVVELCFHGGALPADTPVEYREYIEEMRDSFSQLDTLIAQANEMTEDEESLDATRIKAIFYALYFGADNPEANATQGFLDCFVAYEERTSTPDEEDSEEELEESYTVAIPITDMEIVWSNLVSFTGTAISEEQKSNADSIYNQIRYGVSTGPEDWIPGAEVPYIGADGFCSPIGAGWESRVTSEFGYRRDPFTGEVKGHTGMDLAVPTGTPVRAALPGTVTVSQYSSSYGYYVMIDHGDGLSTLYAHNSRLVAQVGDTVEAGDIVSVSGSTGRSTGPHLHFEVRVNGQRTDPRAYLPASRG